MSVTLGDRRLAAFMERVRAVPRLDREQERKLALAARDGDEEAGHRLVEANLRFVVAVALQYRRYGIPLAELIAEGSVGLMMAVRRFDPDRGTRFVTYAGYWIRAYVLELVVRSSRMVGAGSGVLRSKVFFRLRRERAQLASVEPDPERRLRLLAERFDVSEERMSAMLRQLDARDLSLDVAVNPGSETRMLDTLRHDGVDQESELMQDEERARLRAGMHVALDALDQRERYIVEQRILGDDELSLAELGRRLGVSRERARQLEARAKRKLRRHLETLHIDAA